jgi:hypothetical protein
VEFTTTRTSRLNQLVVAVIVLTVFEAPALQLFLHGWLAHLLLFALNAGAIVWLLTDAHFMRKSAHRVGDSLEIHLGLRARASIPRVQIASVRRVSDGNRRGITPLDPPNVEVTLYAPASVRGYLRTRQEDKLRLFVDEPDAFVAQLLKICSACSSAHSCLPPESASPQ